MKVLYFHQYFLTPQQAGGTRSYEMARRLVARGHQVTMVTSAYGDAARLERRRSTVIDGIKVIYLPVPYSNEMGFARRLLSFALFGLRASWCAIEEQCDVVFATSTPLTITIPGMIASLRRQVPYVFEVRDMWPDIPIAMGALKNPLLKRLALLLESVTYRRAQHIVALAPGMKSEIVAKGVSADKITVIPNGCDIELFTRARQTRSDDLRNRLPEPARDAAIVMFAGMLGMLNRVQYLGELAAEMAKFTTEVVFVVCGHGRDRELLERHARESGVLGRTFFMLGSVPKVEVARWLSIAEASICLITGLEALYRNAVQNKFFDSLAAGVPVACNFRGWQTEIASRADVGVYLDPEDAGRGARTLWAVLQDRAWVEGARQRCLKLAAEFDRDVLAADLEQVLTSASSNYRK